MKTIKKTFLNKLSVLYLILVTTILVLACGKDKKTTPSQTQGEIKNLHLSDTTKIYYITLEGNAADNKPTNYDFSFDNAAKNGDARNPNWLSITGQGDKKSHVTIIDSSYNSVTKSSVLTKFSVSENLDDIVTKITNTTIKYTDWGIYNRTTHIITPDKDKTIIILKPDTQSPKNSKLYKMQIISIYKDAPETPSNPSDITYITAKWAELK